MAREANQIQRADQAHSKIHCCGPVARSVALTVALGLITGFGAVFLYANVHNVSALMDHKFFQIGTTPAIVWVTVGSVATLGGVCVVKVCKNRQSRAARISEKNALSPKGKSLFDRGERALRGKTIPLHLVDDETEEEVNSALNLLRSRYGKQFSFAISKSKIVISPLEKPSSLTKEGEILLATCQSQLRYEFASLRVPVAETREHEVDNILQHLQGKHGDRYTFFYANSEIVVSHIFNGDTLKEYERVKETLLKKVWCEVEPNMKYIQQLQIEPQFKGCSFLRDCGETPGIMRLGDLPLS